MAGLSPEPARSRTGEPRTVALVGFGAEGAALAQSVAPAAEGLTAVPPEAFVNGAGGGDTLVLVARPDDPCALADGVFARAVEDGQLAIAVIVSAAAPATGGVAAEALRSRADILVTTTDEAFLSVLVQWLERPA